MTEQARSDRRRLTAVLAIAGLLVAIAIVGIVGIAINRAIQERVENAVAYDIELEDRGDDLRVALLEVRHYHRDLLLNNPDPTRVDLWQQRYEILVEEIDAAARLVERHPARADIPDVEALRRQAAAYHDDFETAVRTEVTDLAGFRDVATDLLVPLEEMQVTAVALDQAGEERAASAFAEIDEATTTGTLVLLAVIVGVGAMGVVLGMALFRLLREQRRLMLVEQAAARQMADASRAKTDFIADASHELRTPLTVLRGNAEIGLALEGACAHQEILSEIVEESARMSRLVDDLLFLARSDANEVPLDLREVDAAELIGAVAGRAEVLARERGAGLAADVAGVRGRLRADPGRIEQALLVLVDNAAKYGPDDGTIELEARSDDDRLVVDVRDRGPGIPPNERARVFERFYRVDGGAAGPRGRASGGSGLGLSIAAAIVEGHGGRVGIEDRPGGGTVMSVALPLRRSSADGAKGSSKPADVEAST